MKNWIYILAFAMLACSTDTNKNEILIEETVEIENTLETEDEQTNKQVTDNNFNAFYKKVITSILTKNANDVNSFIHKDYGLYFIETPGALPMLTKVYTIEKFKDVNTHKVFFELPFTEIDKMPVNDSLPKIICDDNIYDKQGCFMQEINPLNKTQIWNYADLNDKQKQEIEIIAQTIAYTVVNTANYSFYFSLIDNNWYVTFIDLRTPCSA